MAVSQHGWKKIKNDTPLLKIVRVWFVTPLIGCLLFLLLYFVSHLRYVP